MIALAALARSMSDDALVGALHARGVPTTGMRDLFDLAEWLLTPTSVQSALADFDRTHLAVLGATAAIIAETGAEPESTVAYAAVAERLSHVARRADRTPTRCAPPPGISPPCCSAGPTPTASPCSAVSASASRRGRPRDCRRSPSSPPRSRRRRSPTSGADTRMLDALAAERAFSTVAAIAELVTAVGTEPARELGKGGLSLPDAKRLALAMSIPHRAGRRSPEGGGARRARRAERHRLDADRCRWRLVERLHARALVGPRLGLVRGHAHRRARHPGERARCRGVRASVPTSPGSIRHPDRPSKVASTSSRPMRSSSASRRAARPDSSAALVLRGDQCSRRRGPRRPAAARGRQGLPAARPHRHLPRPPGATPRRPPAHPRRRGEPRARLELPRDGGIRRTGPRRRRDRGVDARLPRRDLAHRACRSRWATSSPRRPPATAGCGSARPAARTSSAATCAATTSRSSARSASTRP